MFPCTIFCYSNKEARIKHKKTVRYQLANNTEKIHRELLYVSGNKSTLGGSNQASDDTEVKTERDKKEYLIYTNVEVGLMNCSVHL